MFSFVHSEWICPLKNPSVYPVMEVREVWRQTHLKQPLGSRDGSRTRQRGGSGLKSTTGGSRGGSSSIDRAGGVLHQITIKGPHTLKRWVRGHT